MIVREILKGISNEHTIAQHLIGDTPIAELVKMHNKIAAVDDRVPKVTHVSTGLELKDAVRKHEAEIQIKILYKYIEAKQKSLYSTNTNTIIFDKRKDNIGDPAIGRRNTDIDINLNEIQVVSGSRDSEINVAEPITKTELAELVETIVSRREAGDTIIREEEEAKVEKEYDKKINTNKKVINFVTIFIVTFLASIVLYIFYITLGGNDPHSDKKSILEIILEILKIIV